MKRIFKYLSLIIIFLITSNVYAIDECSTKEMNRLKELANNVKINYNYEIQEKELYQDDYIATINYTINFLNLNNELKVYYNNINGLTDISSFDNTNLKEGAHLEFSIYSYTTNLCTNTLLKKITLDLPYYNNYYYKNKEKCLNYPDFKYCQEFMEVSEDDFFKIDQEFSQYIKDDSKKDLDKDNKKIYIIISLIVIVFLILLVIIIIKKRNKKDEI